MCDTDECLDENNSCSKQNRICVNKVGGYDCGACLRDFQESSGICVVKRATMTDRETDVDECESMNKCTWLNRECVNTIGSYDCGNCLGDLIEDMAGNCVQSCPEGEVLTSHGNCAMDTCNSRNNPCFVSHRECVTSPEYSMGYDCGNCLPGFLSQDGQCVTECGIGFLFDVESGTKCLDINECLNERAINECYWQNRECINGQGSYTCGDCLHGLMEDRVSKSCISKSFRMSLG